jgi:hypothetical protein
MFMRKIEAGPAAVGVALAATIGYVALKSDNKPETPAHVDHVPGLTTPINPAKPQLRVPNPHNLGVSGVKIGDNVARLQVFLPDVEKKAVLSGQHPGAAMDFGYVYSPGISAELQKFSPNMVPHTKAGILLTTYLTNNGKPLVKETRMEFDQSGKITKIGRELSMHQKNADILRSKDPRYKNMAKHLGYTITGNTVYNSQKAWGYMLKVKPLPLQPYYTAPHKSHPAPSLPISSETINV